MSYYFPFGGSEATTTQNISHSLLATTASAPVVNTITALTASFASSVVNSPAAGTNGISVTLSDCQTSASLNPSLLVSGAVGNQGLTGSKGTDVLICPAETVRCTDLEVSLSAAFTYNAVSYPNGLNGIRPSGSQFSIICMQVPTTCSSTQALAGCPEYLHIANPSIP
jgi:hypothetical protein